jgi:beta-galactosidase
MRKDPVGIALSKEISDFIRVLDPSVQGTKRAVTSAYPGVGEDEATDDYLAPLDVAGYNYSPERYTEDHKRLPDRVIVATETFPADSIDYWIDSWEDNWVLGNFIWTAIDYIGESSIGNNGHNTPSPLACGQYCAQPWPYHISFCGDIDVVGGQKPQAYLRRVLWNNSKLEMAVHAPVAKGQQEVIGQWGYPDERQSWTWDSDTVGESLGVNVYSNHECVKLFLNDKQLDPAGSWTPDPADAKCAVTNRHSRFTTTYNVPYAAGDLTARSYVGGVLQSTVRARPGRLSALSVP